MTELVSVDALGGFANESSFVQDISADGRLVAFTSFASDLVAGDTNGASNPNSGIDVFVRDRKARRTERANVSSMGAQADGASLSADLSPDGHVVAFPSAATNLVADDTNNRQDVFVHDRRSGSTERVSVSSAGAESDSDSFSAVVSRDGRFVAFDSAAANLAPGDVNANADVFVYDVRTGTTQQVSVSDAGAPANAASFDVSLSADGRLAAFTSPATNLVAGDTNGQQDVFARDLHRGTTERVSLSAAGAQANGPSQIPSISPDGRVVVFDSFATNFVPGDTPLTPDLFLRERRTGVTERVVPDVHISGPAALSAKAREVAFASGAPNLVPGDTNGRSDVFVRLR